MSDQRTPPDPDPDPDRWTLIPAVVSMAAPEDADVGVLGDLLVRAAAGASDTADEYGAAWPLKAGLYLLPYEPANEAGLVLLVFTTWRTIPDLPPHLFALALYAEKGRGGRTPTTWWCECGRR
ncbi:hypothetical protein ACFQHO_53985 [Actinomadura yumaensis]|uniref:hypothetical protein n=1 Tax=Actinomadura yumaensis TaxID=111807 RepID=UPI00361FF464